ncbi:endonuclease/exonuclease/phosphatase family protein [Yinghuangia aomiensis]
MTELGAHLVVLREKAAADGREVVVCGDWNIGHTEADIKNWRGQPQEERVPARRARLARRRIRVRRLHRRGRSLHPGVAGPYSVVVLPREGLRHRPGWRIDYHAATPGLAKTAGTAVVERAATYAERWSDHAPVTVAYDFAAE